jgi:uncharacterized protein YbjQ (UPF0145 family)
MNKARKYTLLTVILAVVFIFCSMTGMNLILHIRERQLLTESGRIVMDTPVSSWQAVDSKDEGETGENAVVDRETTTLTTEQIEEVINGWNQRTGVTVHSPVNGQISMEDAIATAQRWLDEMKLNDNGQERDPDVTSMSAVLGVATQEIVEGVQLEPYYSIWTVQIQSESIKAEIYINAVTGNVWGAEITLYEAMAEKGRDNRLQTFVELAGLHVADEDLDAMEAGETRTEIAIKGSRLYAKEQSYSMSIAFNDSYKQFAYQLHL